MTGTGDLRWLELSYDAYPRIEEALQAALDESLHPRGPELLYDLIRDFGLAPGSVAVDVGCGEGWHSLVLAERFQLSVIGLDPVPRHIELASQKLAARDTEVARRVRFELGAAESLPLADETVDLVWCRDVLGHVADLDQAYAEFQRVLRVDGRALVYQMFGTDRLEPQEAAWLWKTMGVVPTSADPSRTEAAISAAGLRVDDCIDLSEWGEWAEEHSGKSSRLLLHASRLLCDPQRYVGQFGRAAYEIKLGDCLCTSTG
jgi:SAM-dependent methyltransferase